ncbi:MAG: polysaccharide biosynthesis protein [Cloacibacillus evryensis]
MVTGAGGSIGSEICRQVPARGPRALVALGHGEQSILAP